MTDKLNCDGVNIVKNNGKEAGQTVYHFHIHLIPRYIDDGQSINWNPQKVSNNELEKLRILLNNED